MVGSDASERGGVCQAALVGDELDHEELDELEHDGVVVFRPPLDHRDVRYAVASTEYWRFMRPSRAFFDRVRHRSRREV